MSSVGLGSINAVRVFVHDLVAAEHFYGAQLGLVAGVATPDFLIYETGSAQLIVEPVSRDDADHRGYVGRFTGISFDVDDMTATYRKLVEKGVVFQGVPAQQDWGGILAHITDPDGNILSLVELP